MVIYFNSIEDKQMIYDLYLKSICCNKPKNSWVNPVTEFSIDVDNHGVKRLIIRAVHTTIKKILSDDEFNCIMSM